MSPKHKDSLDAGISTVVAKLRELTTRQSKFQYLAALDYVLIKILASSINVSEPVSYSMMLIRGVLDGVSERFAIPPIHEAALRRKKRKRGLRVPSSAQIHNDAIQVIDKAALEQTEGGSDANASET